MFDRWGKYSRGRAPFAWGLVVAALAQEMSPQQLASAGDRLRRASGGGGWLSYNQVHLLHVAGEYLCELAAAGDQANQEVFGGD